MPMLSLLLSFGSVAVQNKGIQNVLAKGREKAVGYL